MAAGDILSCTIRATGWDADVVIEGFTTGATYDFGTLPASPKFYLTVVSEGYNSAGTLGTTTRTVRATHVVRKVTPDEATLDEAGGGNLTVRIAFDEPIYLDDNTGAGKSGTAPTFTASAGWCVNSGGGAQASAAATAAAVANNSTLVYPQAIAQWDHIAGVCTADMVDADFRLAAEAYHKFGIACVRFDATGDGSSNNVNETVTGRSAVERTATGLFVASFRTAALALSGFTQAEAISCRFRVYPKVGDASSILDSNDFTTADNECLGYNKPAIICNKTGALTTYAFVDVTTGNNGTGVASTTLATAQASPFQHVGKATEAGANVIYLLAGTQPVVGTAPASRVASTKWVKVQPAPGESSSTVTVQITATTTYKCARMQFDGVKVTLLNTSSYLDGEDADNFLRFTNCVFDSSGVAQPSVPLGYRSNCIYFENNTGDLGRTNWEIAWFSTSRCAYQMDGCELAEGSTGQMSPLYRLSACHATTPIRVLEKDTNNPAPGQDGMIYSFNVFLSMSGAVDIMVLHSTVNVPTIGFAFVGNVMEKTGSSAALLVLCADSSTVTPANHIVMVQNTGVGDRWNVAYNETGTTSRLKTNWAVKGNAVREFNIKTDTFGTPSANRIGNWSMVNGVGCRDNRYEVDSGSGSFQPDYVGVNSDYVGNDAIAFVDNASLTGDNTGGGDYTPDAGSVLLGELSAEEPFVEWDLTGRAVPNDGTGAIGALQPEGGPAAATAPQGILFNRRRRVMLEE